MKSPGAARARSGALPPRPPRASALRKPLVEGAAATASGAALFAAAAAIERAAAATPRASALVEEGGKAILILGAGLAGLLLARRREKTPASPRAELMGRARGLSLGLVAAAAFAAAENLAYFLAFPEAGILARLLWSLPVHLIAALLEALGALPLLGLLARRGASPDGLGPGAGSARTGHGRPGALRPLARRVAGLAARALAFPLALAAAGALHALANEAAAGGLPPSALALGAIAGICLFAALAAAFSNTAYVGGFLHGTD